MANWKWSSGVGGAAVRAPPVDIIDRHGYDCKYDAFIARIENCCFPGKRWKNVSDLIRIPLGYGNSFRPDKKSAINFYLGWITFTESYVG